MLLLRFYTSLIIQQKKKKFSKSKLSFFKIFKNILKVKSKVNLTLNLWDKGNITNLIEIKLFIAITNLKRKEGFLKLTFFSSIMINVFGAT